MQTSTDKSERSASKWPMLWIDFRLGSVEMRLGQDVLVGRLPMNSADQSQCNSPSGWCQLEKMHSEQQPAPGV